MSTHTQTHRNIYAVSLHSYKPPRLRLPITRVTVQPGVS